MVLLAALGGAEVQVKSHVYGALKVENTKEGIVCALVHARGYMGIPRLFIWRSTDLGTAASRI
ncbi:hypothetical protein [Agathobaculum sp. Marseille-P7918]|uniref:hypothetical protein n=1 Tax=Agathobaculum sp. Marseille-P7918 TaxID=2479843 RepID=UPI0035677C23